MDRIEAMSILVEAVEAGSLSAAARKLEMPLSTVSRKVSELEAHLKTQLLVRSNRALTLTDAGRTYIEAAKRILLQLADAERAAAGEYSAPRGELVITAPVSFGRLHVVPVVAEFLTAYPEINVRLVTSDRILNLQDEHIDVALRIGPLGDSELRALRLGMTRRIVCAAPQYLDAHGRPKVPDDLLRHSCITFVGLPPQLEWNFNVAGEQRLVPVTPRLAVSTSDAAIDAAILGLGLTRVLSYQIAAALEAGQLVKVLEDFEPEPFPVSLVYPAQGLLPIKLRAFLDFAAPRIKARIAQAPDASARAPAKAMSSR